MDVGGGGIKIKAHSNMLVYESRGTEGRAVVGRGGQ